MSALNVERRYKDTQTPKIKTPGHCLLSQLDRVVHNAAEDTSLIWPFLAVPRMSAIEKFHSIKLHVTTRLEDVDS